MGVTLAGADLRRAVELMRSVHDGSSDHRAPFSHGTALFNLSLPRVWDLNFMRLERWDDRPTADELAIEADRVQGGAGLGHRRITVEHEQTALALLPGFRRLGWSVQRHIVMAHRRPSELSANGTSVIEIDAERLRAERHDFLGEARIGSDADAVRQLADRVLATARATDLRLFAHEQDGAVVSVCELYSDGRCGQIEDVATRRAHRGRGLARAVVLRAIEASRLAQHELTFLVADEDDWPRRLYERLGFETIGRVHYFAKAPVKN